jgi:hypothetical protein
MSTTTNAQELIQRRRAIGTMVVNELRPLRRRHDRLVGDAVGRDRSVWPQPRGKWKLIGKLRPGGDQRRHGGEPIHRLSAAGERPPDDHVARSCAAIFGSSVFVPAAATRFAVGRPRRAASLDLGGWVRRVVEPAKVDSLSSRIIDRIFGRAHAVLLGPIHPLGQRVAAASSPTLLGRIAAAGAIHTGEQLAALSR